MLYGGKQAYESYEDLATALESGELHSADTKETVAGYLHELIAPDRGKLSELMNEQDGIAQFSPLVQQSQRVLG